MRYLIIALCLAFIGACASDPKTIEASYVSPLKYADFGCVTIAKEIGMVTTRSELLYKDLSKISEADKVQMGVGLMIFWPTLLMLEGGDGPKAVEFAQLKGEYNALIENAKAKDCGIAAQSPEELFNKFDEEVKAERNRERKKRKHFIK
ncbi:MAG: metal ABC transporter ATP-binding protein [Pseudomonadota bacterium]